MQKLDAQTQERLLRGSMNPDDAPPGYREAAKTLQAAGRIVPPATSERERAVVAAMAERVRIADDVSGRSLMEDKKRMKNKKSIHRAKVLLVTTALALSAMTGLAFAGALPAPAQKVAAGVLANLGITVPGADSHSVSPTTPSPSVSPQGKGALISDIAKNTTSTGVNKGAEISGQASNGQSQAGQHGKPSPTPTSSGTGTGDTSSGGTSSTGTSTANQDSGGHSSPGSGKASGSGHAGLPSPPPAP